MATEAAWLNGNNLEKEEKEKSAYKEKQNQDKTVLDTHSAGSVKFRRFGAGIFKA